MLDVGALRPGILQDNARRSIVPRLARGNAGKIVDVAGEPFFLHAVTQADGRREVAYDRNVASPNAANELSSIVETILVVGPAVIK